MSKYRTMVCSDALDLSIYVEGPTGPAQRVINIWENRCKAVGINQEKLAAYLRDALLRYMEEETTNE